MIARITDELGVEVLLRQLTTSTIAQLADIVAHSHTTKGITPIKRIALQTPR